MRYQTAFLAWLPFVVVITGTCLLVYAAVQQNYRQSLNDPQIQMVEDMAARLASGESPTAIIPKSTKQIDIHSSLSPWIAIYDEQGKPLVSTGVLHRLSSDVLPAVPIGVLEHAKGSVVEGTYTSNVNKVTWQPEQDNRQAIVAAEAPSTDLNYYVVAGRNMREVEGRIDSLTTVIVLAWLIMVVLTALLLVVPVYASRR